VVQNVFRTFDILNLLGRVHECNRQTDGQMDAGRTEPPLAIARFNVPR